MKNKKWIILASLILTLSVLVFNSFEEVASAEKEIVVGRAADLSGPFAPSATGIANGGSAHLRYVNEKLGGLKGIKVKEVVVDTAYNLDREISAYKKFKDEDKAIFMINTNSAAAYAIERMMEESGKGMPHTHTSDPGTVFRGPGSWYFGSYHMPPDAATAQLNWFMNNRWKKSEKPKVALVNSDVGVGRLLSFFLKNYLDRNGFSIVGDLIIPPRPMDTTSFVLHLREKKPDVILGMQTDAGWTVMLKDMRRFDVNNPVLIGCCLDESALNVLGNAALGVILPFPMAIWNDTDVPIVRLIHQLVGEWYPGQTKTMNFAFFWGWMQSTIVVEAIKRAMDKVGYEGLVTDIEKGRKVVRDVMESEMRGFDCGGMTKPLIYKPDDHRSFDELRMYEVVSGGEFKFVGWAKAAPLPPEQKTVKWWEDAMKGATKK